MAFPKVKHCLICDTTREEAGGKMALLGFFGVAPDVFIGVRDFKVQTQITFVMLGEQLSGSKHRVGFQLVRDGKVVQELPPQPGPFDQGPPGRLMLIVQISRVYEGPGKYALCLVVDDKLHFEAPFTLTQAKTP